MTSSSLVSCRLSRFLVHRHHLWQELLRHADIRTTMNTYTQAMPAALRDANSKVARLVVQ